MPYCDQQNCNKDKAYNIVNLINAVIQNIDEYKMITGKIPNENHLSYNDIKEKMIKETDVNRLQDNGYWNKIVRKTKFSELQKLRRVILKSKQKDEIKTESQTITIKQEPNNEIEIEKEEIENNEFKDNLGQPEIDNKREVEYKLPVVDEKVEFDDEQNTKDIEQKDKSLVVNEIEYHESEQKVELLMVNDEQNMKEIEYNKPEQETESLVVNDEQNMKEIEYNQPEQEDKSLIVNDEQNMKQIEYPSLQNDDMEVESSTVDNEQMKAIEYHKSDQIDDMEGVEFPSIDNTSDMEDVLLHFRFNEEDIRYTNFIKARELYTEMFNDPQMERLQDGQHWSIKIDNLNCDYLPTNFKTKMHELRQWTYNKKREDMNKIEYSQTHLDGILQTDNEETSKIEYPMEIQKKKTTTVITFPTIDNVDEMETTLSSFKINDKERHKDPIQEYIIYHNMFKHILEADYESLKDEYQWSILIRELSYNHLPDNYKEKLSDFYKKDLEKKKQQQIDKEIRDNSPSLLNSITDYSLDLFGYGPTDKKQKHSELQDSTDKKRKHSELQDSIEDEAIKEKQRKLNGRDPKRASKMRPKLVKPGFNNIVDDIIIDINNIIDQYKKTMDISLEDYSKQFKEIRKIIHEKYKTVLYKSKFLDLLYDHWVLAKPKSDLVTKYKSEIIVNDVEKLVDKFTIEGKTKFSI
jgi:hypothetical protein